MTKYFHLVFLIVIVLLASSFLNRPTTAEAQTKIEEPVLSAPQPIHTESRFETKLESQVKIIDRDVIYKDDPETEIGTETVLQEGADGKKTTITKVSYYEGKEYSRDIVSTEIEPSKDKIVSRGTKIIWRPLQTPNGQINYWRRLRVWATHYDSYCSGCGQFTATGMRQGKGVIAVDPSVIKLGTKVYVPGYGQAVAGDTGGAIKGNIIDLGFDDARTAGWTAHFVDIYLL